jgi:hypothetical protein
MDNKQVEGSKCADSKCTGHYVFSKLESTSLRAVWRCNVCPERISRPTSKGNAVETVKTVGAGTAIFTGIAAAFTVGSKYYQKHQHEIRRMIEMITKGR